MAVLRDEKPGQDPPIQAEGCDRERRSCRRDDDVRNQEVPSGARVRRSVGSGARRHGGTGRPS
jgi:hypothetical protein